MAWQDHDPLRVQLVGLGRPDDFRCSLFGPARVWQSATPFVVTRHVKKRGQKKDPPECHGLAGRLHFAARVVAEEYRRWVQRQATLANANLLAYTPLQEGAAVVHFGRWSFVATAVNPAMTEPVARRLCFAWNWTARCPGHAANFGLGLFLAAE